MKITEITPQGFQLTRMGLVNCYLVRESDGFTLIDTGIGGGAKAILNAARQCGTVGHGQICRILLTHAHGDHIGSLDAVAHLLGNAAITISRREARLLPKKPMQDRSLDPGEPPCKIKGSLPGATCPATHFVGDGELYGSLRCFATPGHTPGHFSFLDERDGTLYTGDAMLTVGGKPHVPGFGPWYFPLAGLATWHRPTAVASVRKLLGKGVRRIAPGHGKVLEGGDALLEAALRGAQ